MSSEMIPNPFSQSIILVRMRDYVNGGVRIDSLTSFLVDEMGEMASHVLDNKESSNEMKLHVSRILLDNMRRALDEVAAAEAKQCRAYLLQLRTIRLDVDAESQDLEEFERRTEKAANSVASLWMRLGDGSEDSPQIIVDAETIAKMEQVLKEISLVFALLYNVRANLDKLTRNHLATFSQMRNSIESSGLFRLFTNDPFADK